MWYILTSSKYTWSWKQIPEVEWDKQEETQPLELPYRLAHICCQIPSLSPSLSYDQQCYQWSTGRLNCFMETYPVLLVKALRLCIQLQNGRWVTDLCPTPTAFSVTQMGVRKSRKHILDKFEFDGGKTVIKTAEAKNKIMISFYGSRDWTFVILKPSTTQVLWTGTQQTHKWFWYSVDVDKKLEKQYLENSCTAVYEQLCCLVDEILVKRKWIMEMTYLLEKYTDSRTPLNLTQITCLRN